LFVWVGVLVVYMSLTATPALSHLWVQAISGRCGTTSAGVS
jgi:hypothetical protein